MMLKPSIDSLLKEVPSKYSLVILASKRAAFNQPLNPLIL